MNSDEAIKTLQELWRETNDSWYEETYKVAIEALKQPSNATQLLDDGTLKVKVANVLDIKRVMVMDDNVIYDSYYPDRPHGEWIFNPKDAIELMFTKPKCSKCGFESSDCGNFCSNCGADMRGDVM